jgi:hypothetical protein
LRFSKPYYVPRPIVIPEHRFIFIIIEKEGHGKP